MLIRVWMRTAVRKEVTSFGTFLSTLCHEFCHHLDFQKFGFPDSWHTRGFYERAAALYHHARGTPPKRLFWVPVAGGVGESIGRGRIGVRDAGTKCTSRLSLARRRFLRQLLFLAKHGDVPAYGFRAVPVTALLFMAVAIAASMGFSYFIAIFVSEAKPMRLKTKTACVATTVLACSMFGITWS